MVDPYIDVDGVFGGLHSTAVLAVCNGHATCQYT